MYFIENNEYAVGTHTEQAAAVRELSIRASSYNMFGRIVNGDDVIAVYETVKDSAEAVRNGKGPCIIEAKCYRHYHHAGDQPGSSFGYREKTEEAAWLEKDAVKTFPETVIKAGIFNKKTIEALRECARKTVESAVDFCMTREDKCRIKEELWPDPETAAFGMRSEGTELERLSYSERKDFSTFEQIRFSDAIAAITGRWLERNAATVVFGEEVANFGGGAYGATKGLPQKYPDRIINTPISETGFIGLTCGAAMSGMRPIVEIMFPDFALVAADQLFNQIGKARHMYGGKTNLPLVARTRIATGNGYGGQHSMDPVGLFSLFPGWRIIAPSNAFDYIGLFNTAMTSYDPVVFLEHHALYTKIFNIPKDNLDYCIPFGKARIITEGDDLTVLTYGSITDRVANLEQELSSRGVSIEIIDLRSVDLPSVDYETIGRSIKKTGAVATVEEAAKDQSIGAKITAYITEQFFDDLDAPPGNLTSLNVPTSVSKVLESAAIISDEQITDDLEAMGKRRWR
jgi:2-oxoisovalerate dehydrogenase E1 component